jgi:hypothetical protein
MAPQAAGAVVPFWAVVRGRSNQKQKLEDGGQRSAVSGQRAVGFVSTPANRGLVDLLLARPAPFQVLPRERDDTQGKECSGPHGARRSCAWRIASS